MKECPRCGEDLTEYAEDDFVWRKGDDRPYCSGECVVRSYRDSLRPYPSTEHYRVEAYEADEWNPVGLARSALDEARLHREGQRRRYPGMRCRIVKVVTTHTIVESDGEHTGGNAENCPACIGTNPPYPFNCPGSELS